MTKEQIELAFKKAEVLYRKRMDKLQTKCKHDFERFSGHAGTDYCCKKCGYWK